MSWDKFQPPPEQLALLDKVQLRAGDLLSDSSGSSFNDPKQQHGAKPNLPLKLASPTGREPARSADPLSTFEEACRSACGAVDSALALLDSIDEQHRSVAGKTSALHEQCRNLAEEERKSRDVVDKIAKPLSYFDSLYVLGSRLGAHYEGQEA